MAAEAVSRLALRLRRLTVGGWLRLGASACAVLALGLATLAHAQAPTPNQSRALLGHMAPAFSAPAAQHGQLLAQMASYDPQGGRLTLLVFFDTLCVHCLAGVRTADAVAQTSTPLRIIYLDAPGENASITDPYMTREHIDAPVLLDAGAHIASRYGVAYYPSFILIDARGIVRDVWTGTPTTNELRAAIAQAAH
jgi:peroxiredoxin